VASAPYYRVDVFAERAFAGNPLAVFPDADAIDADAMQAIAREMNLSETVFVQRPTAPQADLRLRIFTIDRELPLAGHPTIGAVFALATHGHLDLRGERPVVWCELGAGVMPVEVIREGAIVREVVMTQRAPRFGDLAVDPVRMAAALGLPPRAVGAGDLPISVVDTGIPWLIVPIADLSAMRAVVVDGARCAAIAEVVGTDAFYAFTQEVVDPAATAHARHLAFGTLTPGEDPGTGSAAGCLSAFLVKEGVLLAAPTAELVIEQGLEIGRPSRITARVDTKGGAIERVCVGGRAVPVGEGVLSW
jgi:trans-2,3-dihydro-3-hydroxyanthranilate isomerase